MTLRIGHIPLSGLALWALFMAFMGLTTNFVINDGQFTAAPATAAGMLVAIAGYDTVVRLRHGGEWPTGRRHTIAAAAFAGTLAVTLTAVVFLTFPGA